MVVLTQVSGTDIETPVMSIAVQVGQFWEATQNWEEPVSIYSKYGEFSRHVMTVLTRTGKEVPATSTSTV